MKPGCGLAGKPSTSALLTHHRRLTALWCQALPHDFASMSPDLDHETLGETSNPDFGLSDVHSGPDKTPLSSESGSQPDDDLIHPAKRPRKGPAPRTMNI